MRRAVLIVLLAGIIGVLIFLAIRKPSSSESVPAPEAQAEVVETRREAEVLAPAVEREALAAAEVTGWRVRVLDGHTNAAVAGATVSVLDLGAIDRELEQSGIGFHTIEGLRLRHERALEVRTGADGCADIPTPPEHAMVEARSGANWAFAVVNKVPDDRCVTLTLALDRTLPVRVIAAAGNPVGGVPVDLRSEIASPHSTELQWTDTQAQTGLATFLHFQRRLGDGRVSRVLLAFPVRDQQQLPVGADTPSEPPPTLVLPDTGRVRFRVRTPDGAVPDLEGVALHLEASVSGTLLCPDGPWAKPRLDAQGEALAPWMGLGLQLKAALVQEEEELVARSIDGPARSGEEVLCEIVLQRPTPTFVTGRFVFHDGRPWPAASVNVFTMLFPLSSRRSRMRQVAVDDHGRFRIPVQDPRPANGTRTLNVRTKHPDGHGDLIADIPLDQDIPPAGLDLGDVLFDYGELVVSGHVVDAAHEPIAGAFFLVLRHTRVYDADIWPLIQTTGTWNTTADGGFALYLLPGAAQPAEELRLRTHATGYVTEDMREIRRGESNVEVVLAKAGALAGSLALDPGLATGDVELALPGEARRVVQLRPDSTFEESGLSPGTYSLEVRRRGTDGQWENDAAALVDGLVVQSGETCRDPRIQSLRIANVLPSLRIRIVDRASAPIRNAAVSITGLAGGQAALSQDDGVCLVRIQTLPVDLEVSAFGYLRQSLTNVGSDREVMLDTGFPIRLRTSTKPSGSNPKYMLNVHLSSLNEKGEWRGSAWGPEFWAGNALERFHFDERGELALRMPAAGVYECGVSVTVHRSDGMFTGGTVKLSPNPRITVLAGEVEQLFEISIPQEAVQAAVEAALK